MTTPPPHARPAHGSRLLNPDSDSHDARYAQYRQEATSALLALAEFAPPLSAADKVVISEAWNRMLPWRDMFMEGVALRWLWVTEPEGGLQRALGSRVHDLRELLFGLLDLAVRALHPERQTVHREAYRPAHPDPTRECQTLPAYLRLFSELGVRPQWWVQWVDVVLWAFRTHAPYNTAVEREDLDKGRTASALGRFLATYIAQPAVQDGLDMRDQFRGAVYGTAGLIGHWLDRIRNDDERATLGQQFYRLLFAQHPELLDYFKSADMDRLALHVIQSIELVLASARDIGEYDSPSRRRIEQLGRLHRQLLIPTWAYPFIGVALCESVGLADRGSLGKAQLEEGLKRVYHHVVRIMSHPMQREERLLHEAEIFFEMLAQECGWSPERLQGRMLEVRMEVTATGTYTHTSEEIEHGARVAWRNSSKCIGRISWNTLVVRDRRHVTDPKEIFHEVEEHLKLATGGTNLLSVMTVFRPRRPDDLVGLRFWNAQLVRYAGYPGEGPGGDVLGDPANADFTQHLIDQGLWQPPTPKSAFDVLPLVIQLPDSTQPYVYALPPELAHQARITHPRFPKFQDLGLRWPTVPAITNFEMTLGGVSYSCAPFNGWFMELEVVRNLIERYKISEQVAEIIGVPTTQKLWQGRVFQETAAAVLHSFEAAKFTMVDQYSAQASFLTHCQRERTAGRECPAQWQWLGGLVGAGLNPLWHLEMRDFKIAGPDFRYCCDLWSAQDLQRTALQGATISAGATAGRSVAGRPRVLILYGSETGTAESVAGRCARSLQLLRPTLAALNDYADDQARATLRAGFDTVLVITSTFGSGQPPGNAVRFAANPLPRGSLTGLRHAVCALGSSIYPDFVAYGLSVEKALQHAGSRELLPLVKADDAQGNAGTLNDWLSVVERTLLPPSLKAALEAGAAHKRGSAPQAPSLRITWTARPAGEDPLDVEIPASGSAICIRNDELLQDGDIGSRSTRLLVLEFPTDQTYETGDHLAVQPQNDRDLVLRFVRVLGIERHLGDLFCATLHDQGEEIPTAMPFRMPARLGHVLRTSIDFTLQPAQVGDWLQLGLRLLFAQSGGLWNQFDMWRSVLQSRGASPEQREAVISEVRDLFPSVVLLLEALVDAGGQPRFADVLPLLGRLTARYYSISSSARMFPHRPHITVGVVHDMTPKGVAIHGICSNYLARVQPGERVIATIRKSTFRAPHDPQAPTILVGPGTGYAPLHGFLQDRQAQLEWDGAGLGPCHLFSGCRVAPDRIYAAQIDQWAQQGAVISRLHLALSRADTTRRVYVQSLLREMGQELATLLLDPCTHYYVCGDAKMADACFESCVAVLVTHADMSRVMAVRHLHAMRAAGRWQQDVWGIVESFRESRSDFVKRKNQAARIWLKHFSSDDGTVESERRSS